jgi:hypothetical protein
MPVGKEMADFLAVLKSADRKERWEATAKVAADIWEGKVYTADDLLISYLLKELATDYLLYYTEALAAIDHEYAEMKARYERELADYELRLAKAKTVAQPGAEHLVTVPGKPYFPVLWKAYQEDNLRPPESHFTAVLLVLRHLGPEKSLAGLPLLLKLKWDTAFGWRPYFGEPVTYINEAHEMLIYGMGPQIIPELIQALGQGEPASTHATTILKKWGRESIPYLLKAVDSPDIVVRQRVNAMLAELRAEARLEQPSQLKETYSHVHARLLVLLDESSGSQKTKQRLRTLRSFAEIGSFRRVAASESKVSGYETDHSGPAARLRRLGESLGVPLTRMSKGPGVKRAELTKEGRALAEWLALHPWALD